MPTRPISRSNANPVVPSGSTQSETPQSVKAAVIGLLVLSAVVRRVVRWLWPEPVETWPKRYAPDDEWTPVVRRPGVLPAMWSKLGVAAAYVFAFGTVVWSYRDVIIRRFRR
jgi:hypothetical protein